MPHFIKIKYIECSTSRNRKKLLLQFNCRCRLYLQQPRPPRPVFNVLPDGQQPADEISGYVHPAPPSEHVVDIIKVHNGSRKKGNNFLKKQTRT